MEEYRETMYTILERELEELEKARNVQSKADALIVLKEHLTILLMMKEYVKKDD
jgi:hypothetical protein